jgi:hypothetical protein
MRSLSSIESAMAAAEKKKVDAREEERRLLAELHEAMEAEDDKFVRAYWAQRAKEDPDDPEVLRARADLIEKDRNNAYQRGTVVNARTAEVKGKAN